MTDTSVNTSGVAYEPLESEQAGQSSQDGTDIPEKPHTWFNCCAMWRWYVESPLKRYPFLLFVVLGGLTILWMVFYLTSKTTGYVLSGIVVCLTAVYAFNHFRLLLALKEQVDEYETNNRNFTQENAQLSTEVDRLEKSKEELGNTQDTMRENVERQGKNLENFTKINETLQNVGDGNVDKLFEVKDRSDTMLKQWTKELKSKDKHVVSLVMERVLEETNREENNDNDDEDEYLEKEDYKKFVLMLPNKYIELINERKMTFDKHDDGDGKLTVTEFTDWLDHLVDDVYQTPPNEQVDEEEQKESNQTNDNQSTEP